MQSRVHRKRDTRARIIESASRTIRCAGFDGVTVVNVMASIGRTHGGFYEYFPRDLLLVEAFEATSVSGNAAIAARARSLRETRSSLIEAFVAAYLHREHLLDRENGCAIATLISQIPQQSAAIQHAGVVRSRALASLVLSFLPPMTSAPQAGWIASQLVGALQMARTAGDVESGIAHMDSAREFILACHAASFGQFGRSSVDAVVVDAA